jgi:hypothetical protein
MKLVMRNRAASQRGSFMLGFAALTAVLFMLCAIALERSLDTYRSSALAVEKLQARAAAEGAAVTWANGSLHARTPLQIGECVTALDDETSSSAGATTHISVQVHPKGSKAAALKCRYIAMADTGSSGTLKLQSLELVP